MTSNDEYDDDAIMTFNKDSLKQLKLYQKQYDSLNNAYNETAHSNVARRDQLRNSMNTIAKNINSLQNTQVATYNAAVQNEKQARTTLGQQLGTLGVLKKELDNSQYNMDLLKQDDINKARMADININESKEYEAQMQLFKMISFYLVIILFFGVLGKFIPGFSNITKIICLLITLIMIFHIIRKLVDMYSRSVTNYDEYNFKKPRRSDYSNDVDTDTDDDDDDDDDGDDDNNNNCTTSDDILNHSLNNNSSESFRSIKPYNNNNKSVLGKSKF
jgi:hypothetical protein